MLDNTDVTPGRLGINDNPEMMFASLREYMYHKPLLCVASVECLQRKKMLFHST